MPEKPSAFYLQMSLPVAAVAVIAALVDLCHEAAQSGSILLTANTPPLTFPAEQICRVIAHGWALTGFCHLLTHVTVCSHQAAPPSIEDLDEALQWLVSRGLVTSFPHFRYSLAPEWQPLVFHTRAMDSGFQWQRVSRDAEGAILLSDRIFLIGTEGFLLSLQPGREGRIFLRTETLESIGAFLAAECEPPSTRADSFEECRQVLVPGRKEAGIHRAKPSKPSSQRKTALPKLKAPEEVELRERQHQEDQSKTGTKRDPAARPPGKKAQKHSAGISYCKRCGTAIKAGRRFCTSCGAPVT